MTNHKNSPDDASPPRCRKCRKPLEFHAGETPLDRFGQFIRLGCAETMCGHVDWYKEAEFPPAARPSSAPADGMAEVWVHDIILGLSFKQTDDRV